MVALVEFKPQDNKYAKLVDRYSRYIQSPVARLKFLNAAFKANRTTGLLNKLPMLGTLPDHGALILELSKFLPPTQTAPLGLRLMAVMYRLRMLVYGVCALCIIGACAGVGFGIWKGVTALQSSWQTSGATAAALPATAPNQNASAPPIGAEAALPLDKVWLAEEGEGYEFYSNGARVLTEHQIYGEPRNFYRFDLSKSPDSWASSTALTKPVGIVYHLSEGDLFPFDNQFNNSLQATSKDLLAHAKQRQLYNYVIDRFGRTYRIVRDEFTANHAGRSLWSDGESLYVNLNPSFIGICLEGKSNSQATVGPDGINEAQIYAARVLTAVLRSKYDIADANCVTHGLVSLNVANRLMGFHTDWVAGFPFEAIGLSDKYQAELRAVSRFGFTYDQAYVNAAGGKRWPGLERADEVLKELVKQDAQTVEQVRREQWQRFLRAYSKQRSLDGEKNATEE